MKCQATGCWRSATHMPQIVVPARGWPDGTHDPARVTFRLCCCREHAEGFLLTDETRDGLAGEFAKTGRAAPDFDRATIVAITIAQGERDMAAAAAAQPN